MGYQASPSSERSRVELESVACPKCGAGRGEPCVKTSGELMRYWSTYHSVRFGAMHEQRDRRKPLRKLVDPGSRGAWR